MKIEPDARTTYSTQSLLGATLLGQKKLAEAEPQLLQGFEGMELRQTKITGRARSNLKSAMQRLVQLYEAWDKPGEAAKWRDRLAKSNR